MAPTPREIELHGHPVTYHQAGQGPVVVLVHGITSSSRTWRSVLPLLAARHTVIAPDLLGHGSSAKPPGDYSLGAHASGLRDLLVALDVPRATIVGHSLGGGVAMQFAYQFPERVERLVLVDSGGLGGEVSLVLRAATLPGAEYVLPLLAAGPILSAGAAVGGALARLGLRPSADLRGWVEGFQSLGDASARRAFLHTARSVIDPAGQRVHAGDRLYLTEHVPTLIVWGERDRMIPVAHGRAAHELMPGSRLEVLPRGGHFPFNDDPVWFSSLLHEFVATTEPAGIDDDRIRRLMLRGRA
ncbi:alpha/beta fold hydrolase [Baekduia soli]|uniref:Alpha/beta fold hydrolase n=1 Tax=Baekduia soli TaxID=496014 RepID=A0A5B8U6B8_9ACTN|nr:alpha/beta fold hydrolase [Baekduia soli]QEC48481.1 alpha/beta fold hydrolase [Baekduia soli]